MYAFLFVFQIFANLPQLNEVLFQKHLVKYFNHMLLNLECSGDFEHLHIKYRMQINAVWLGRKEVYYVTE